MGQSGDDDSRNKKKRKSFFRAPLRPADVERESREDDPPPRPKKEEGPKDSVDQLFDALQSARQNKETPEEEITETGWRGRFARDDFKTPRIIGIAVAFVLVVSAAIGGARYLQNRSFQQTEKPKAVTVKKTPAPAKLTAPKPAPRVATGVTRTSRPVHSPRSAPPRRRPPPNYDPIEDDTVDEEPEDRPRKKKKKRKKKKRRQDDLFEDPELIDDFEEEEFDDEDEEPEEDDFDEPEEDDYY